MVIGIVLTILKIIGIILLAVIALLLFIMAIVLFCPFRYGFAGEKTDVISGTGEVRWLFGALKVSGQYTVGTGTKMSIKLFGKVLFGEGKKQKTKKRKKKTVPAEISARSREMENIPTKQQKKAEPVENPLEEKVEIKPVKEKEPVVSAKKETPRRVKMSTLPDPPKKVRQAQQNETHTKQPKKQADDMEQETEEEDTLLWKQFLHQPEKKKVLKAAIRLVRRLMKGILPKHFYFRATIGTGNPAYTGCVLAAAGAAKAKFADRLCIKGNFAQAAFDDVVLRVKGRIVLGGLLVSLVRFLFTKPVWSYIKLYWKGSR